ncbi:hypothetical protein GCM10009623_14820 [Nocardioides aestuarii]|uniref:DUF4097 domain-containing protein n=1 Tax=Nocardioides aestuarii TaxID=252231 RepID=A0ABW4TLW1_9ACTN
MTDHRFETHEPVALFVEIGSGQVDVTATDTTESRVEVTGRHADEVEVTLDGRDLRVVAPRRRNGFFHDDTSLHVTALVPTGSDLTSRTGSADTGVVGEVGVVVVKSGSGDVRLDAVRGPVTVETGSGDVEIEETRAAAAIKCGSGDVSLRTSGASTAVSTGSGDVEIALSRGKTVIKTGSGDVHLGDSEGDVTLQTGSGDLQIDSARRGKVTAKGASGSVRVGVPSGTPIWTDVSTISGRIHNEVQGVGQPEEGADHVELRATTVSGDVVLLPR